MCNRGHLLVLPQPAPWKLSLALSDPHVIPLLSDKTGQDLVYTNAAFFLIVVITKFQAYIFDFPACEQE